METIRTLYGDIPDHLLQEFCRIAGYKIVDGEWTLLMDELEYWQLAEPGSAVEERRWKKRMGWLPVRDLNFQIAYLKNGKDVLKALEYAKQNMFTGNEPIYYPDTVGEVEDIQEDFFANKKEKKKKPKGYNRIITELEERYR